MAFPPSQLPAVFLGQLREGLDDKVVTVWLHGEAAGLQVECEHKGLDRNNETAAKGDESLSHANIHSERH